MECDEADMSETHCYLDACKGEVGAFVVTKTILKCADYHALASYSQTDRQGS